MNILLLHQYFLEKDDGGGSRFNELTRVWEEEGHHTTVLAGMVHHTTGKKRDQYKGKYTFIDPYSEKRTVIRCHVSEAYSRGFAGRLLGYFSFVFSSMYAGIFKARGKYDVIVATSPPLFVAGPAWLLSRWKRIPLVFEVRDLWPESAIDTGVLKSKALIRLSFWLEKFIYRRARLVNVLTPAFREKLVREKGVPAEKVLFIPNAADFSLSDTLLRSFDRDAFRRQAGWAGKVVITYVGAHGVANHLIQVVETAERLRDRPEVHFVLIGDGMEKPMLREAVVQRGLTNVEFIDSVPKSRVFEYILASDFGMSVLKRVDTFKTVYSNKTFDYMACKRPIIMAIDGVSRQLVEESGCGVYVEPENPADFEEKIRRLLDLSPEAQAAMGERGYAFAKAHFDRSVLARQYLQAIQSISKQKK